MNSLYNIPLVDIKAQYLEIKEEIDQAINNCISEAVFIKGKAVTDFENAFANYIGSEYCIGCGNGTDALELILKSLKIGPGDEVLVPALTWIATAEAVNNVGAEPVFVDINDTTYTIDVTKIEAKITNKTKAIIPVHLYGCPAEMDDILSIAKKFGLLIVEDCAQAHGAKYNGIKVGTFGIASAFSFFPSKNLGAFGDGGAVITNTKEIADSVRENANHGQLQTRHSHSIIGRNSRLDSLQAAILKVKLVHLDQWNENRRKAAAYYSSQLKNTTSIIPPSEGSNTLHVYHIYAIRSKIRNKILEYLKKYGIASGIHYPKPLPFLEAYSYKCHKIEEFPVASNISNDILSLPIYPEITKIQIDTICRIIIKSTNTK